MGSCVSGYSFLLIIFFGCVYMQPNTFKPCRDQKVLGDSYYGLKGGKGITRVEFSIREGESRKAA